MSSSATTTDAFVDVASAPLLNTWTGVQSNADVNIDDVATDTDYPHVLFTKRFNDLSLSLEIWSDDVSIQWTDDFGATAE